MSRFLEPSADCRLCPRLAAFRAQNRAAFPDFHNAPVPSCGTGDPRLLVVGLAPALKGANRTGVPFVGDRSGLWLRDALGRFRLGEDVCRIANAVRCVPPANRPTAAELAACRPFLAGELAALARLRAVLALGRVAHGATLAALGLAPRALPFAHGAEHRLPNGAILVDCYHPSPQNTHTGRLTPAMFDAVFRRVRALVDGDGAATAQQQPSPPPSSPPPQHDAATGAGEAAPANRPSP
ncbi:uracil-DNA glycosylase [Azospirillum sp. A39]|uniref:uracil-DNA glycosylase n=1 Tax=Azospirillum sp. A39 TaxID=3462279 RepID=UPI00404648C4